VKSGSARCAANVCDQFGARNPLHEQELKKRPELEALMMEIAHVDAGGCCAEGAVFAPLAHYTGRDRELAKKWRQPRRRPEVLEKRAKREQRRLQQRRAEAEQQEEPNH
jgi:hypothetical protein